MENFIKITYIKYDDDKIIKSIEMSHSVEEIKEDKEELKIKESIKSINNIYSYNI